MAAQGNAQPIIIKRKKKGDYQNTVFGYTDKHIKDLIREVRLFLSQPKYFF